MKDYLTVAEVLAVMLTRLNDMGVPMASEIRDFLKLPFTGRKPVITLI